MNKSNNMLMFEQLLEVYKKTTKNKNSGIKLSDFTIETGDDGQIRNIEFYYVDK